MKDCRSITGPALPAGVLALFLAATPALGAHVQTMPEDGSPAAESSAGPQAVVDRVREELRARLEGPATPSTGVTSSGASGGSTRAAASAPPAISVTAAGERLYAPDRALAFYERRAFAPAWTDGAGPLPAVEGLLRAVRRADLEGLRPRSYHLGAVEAALRRVQHGGRAAHDPDPRELADLDLLLTDAYLSLGTHLAAGAVDPVSLDADWTGDPDEVDLPAHLAEALRDGRVEESLRDLFFAAHPGYFRLRSALARYRTLAESGGWEPLDGADTLGAGERHPEVPALRRRLAATGDLPRASTAADRADDLFDEALGEAVRRFQGRHGLEPDGAVGPATRRALNVPAAERVRQLELNLERWRWMPRALGDSYVLVNIAAFTVDVVEHVETVLRLRAVVGERYRQTPVFSDTMRYLVLNPSWNVPPSIAVEDKLPLIREDPDHLERNGYVLYEDWGPDAAAVDPDTVDWEAMTPARFARFRLHQRPGPANALGRVKFMFPNRFSVYLHDTPERHLFARAVRSFSSGCIRVEDPIALARYVLRGDPNWTAARIDSVLAGGGETTVPLPRPVPVHIQYLTAWTDPDGTVHFVQDLYGRDEALDEALQRVSVR